MARIFALTASAMLAIAPGMVRAAEPCLAPAEFSSLVGFAMPGTIAGVAQRCGPTLPEGAFLRGPARGMIDRYAAVKPSLWPGAKAAIGKLSASAPTDISALLGQLPDPQQQQIVETMVTGMVAEKLPIARCPVLDRLLAILSPLPPESTAEAIGLAIGLGSRAGQARIGKIVICTP